MPHAHILLCIKDVDMPKTCEDYDKFVSAEIPDEKDYPILFNIITNHNIHRHRPMCKSDTSEQCTKGFPKDFQKHTVFDENGFTLYKRRSPSDGGNYFTDKSGKVITNMDVVPY